MFEILEVKHRSIPKGVLKIRDFDFSYNYFTLDQNVSPPLDIPSHQTIFICFEMFFEIISEMK